MNRQEMITKMQDKLNDFYRCEDKRNFDEVARELYSDMEKLKQPITLAEFLGWEEDVVYKYDNDKFIIMDNQLYMRNYTLRDWIDYDVSINRFGILRQAKRSEEKKYYILNSEIKDCNYLQVVNLYEDDEEIFFGKKSKLYGLKNQFSEDEYKYLKEKYATVKICEIEEV